MKGCIGPIRVNYIPIKYISNSSGNTLISLLISLAVSGIMMAAMMSFFTNQLRAQKRLAQKYETLDLKNSIMRAMTRSEICKDLLTSNNVVIKKNIFFTCYNFTRKITKCMSL